MADHENRFFQELNEEWDAEKAVQERRDFFRTTEEQLKTNAPAPHKLPTAPEPPAAPPRKPGNQKPVHQKPGNRRPGNRKRRKKKVNVRGWLILIGIGLAVILLLVGLITLLVHVFSSDKGKETEVPSESLTVVETTESRMEKITPILEEAEKLAGSYNYEEALSVLHEYGTDWAQQPELKEAETKFLQAQEKLVRWPDVTTIPHAFFRPVIIDPARAFDGDENETLYNQSMITEKELRAILQELYNRGYVLINMHDMVKEETDPSGYTAFKPGDIYLPEGKKPIVLSQEDVNYYRYRVAGSGGGLVADAEGDGFACKLLLDENGKITNEYVDAQGNVLYGAYDFATIVDEFVEAHPDFSYRGAKGVLAVTGVEGVFGLQTHPEWEKKLGEEAYMNVIRQGQEIAEALKKDGWEIASMGYAKISNGNVSVDEMKENLDKWENQVEPVVGNSDIFIYANGSDIAGMETYSGEKFDLLYNAGYRFFVNMDSAPYFVQIKDNYMRQARRVIDGYRLEYSGEFLADLFDAAKIIDDARPRPVPQV